jgi:hypothetical protein
VAIAAKSVDDRHPCLIAVVDFGTERYFWSKDEPGQWICWDFREMRVSPTHYTVWTQFLNTWILEGSLDGSSWMEIDRPEEFALVNGSGMASFAALTVVECRFIRLTQTGKRVNDRGELNDKLTVRGVEFFGALFEYR